MTTSGEAIRRGNSTSRPEQELESYSNRDLLKAYQVHWNCLKQAVEAGELSNSIYQYRELRTFWFPWPPLIYISMIVSLVIGCHWILQ
jgi:hypothetical protein